MIRLGLIRERKLLDTAPLYLRDGDPIPEGVDPDNRIIVVTRSYVEPPKREEDQLPTATQEPMPAVERTAKREPLEYPNFAPA